MKGWIRLLTDMGEKTVYWDGAALSNIQRRTLKDIAANLGYDTFHNQNYLERARLGLGAREVAKEGELNYIATGEERLGSERDKQKLLGKVTERFAGIRRRVLREDRTGRPDLPGLQRGGEEISKPRLSAPRLAVDQRIVKSHGSDWKYGFDSLGLPHPPRRFSGNEVPTGFPETARISKRISEILGIPEGVISRPELHDAIVERFLMKGAAARRRTRPAGAGHGLTTAQEPGAASIPRA